jgi:hypothetical protein
MSPLKAIQDAICPKKAGADSHHLSHQPLVENSIPDGFF